jgi:hypothetical protein
MSDRRRWHESLARLDLFRAKALINRLRLPTIQCHADGLAAAPPRKRQTPLEAFDSMAQRLEMLFPVPCSLFPVPCSLAVGVSQFGYGPEGDPDSEVRHTTLSARMQLSPCRLRARKSVFQDFMRGARKPPFDTASRNG